MSGSLSDENDSRSDIFWQTRESWNAGKLSLLENCHWTEVGRLYLFIHVRVVLIRMVS